VLHDESRGVASSRVAIVELTYVSNTIALGFVALTIAGAAFRAGQRFMERRRARVALSRAPDLDDTVGEGTVVRVTGTVGLLGDPLVAPLSGVECVMYRSRIYVGDGIFKRNLWRVQTFETQELTRFSIDTGRTGRHEIIVEGSHAWLDVPAHKSDNNDARKRLMLRLGVHYSEMPKSRFEELVVRPGMRVSIAGVLMLDPAVEPSSEERGFRDEPRSRVRLAGTVKHPLIVGTAVDGRA
jgi:hypothetical protein